MYTPQPARKQLFFVASQLFDYYSIMVRPTKRDREKSRRSQQLAELQVLEARVIERNKRLDIVTITHINQKSQEKTKKNEASQYLGDTEP